MAAVCPWQQMLAHITFQWYHRSHLLKHLLVNVKGKEFSLGDAKDIIWIGLFAFRDKTILSICVSLPAHS